MTLFLLYLWLKLEAIHITLGICTGGVIFVTFLGALLTGDYEPNWDWIKRMKRWLIAAFLLTIVNVALPTQKEGAYLIAGYAGMKLVETPEMGKLTELVRLKVGNYLDDELTAAKAQAQKAVASAVSK